MITKDLDIYRGDDYLLEIALLNSDGTPANLNGATIELAFGEQDGVLSYATISVSDNVVTAIFTHAATKNIEWTSGVWDLQVAQDGKVTTVARGKIKITRDVTP